MKHRLLFLALGMSAISFAQGSFYHYNYNFSFSGPTAYTISNVYILEDRNAPDYSYSYGFRLPGDQIEAPVGGTVSDYPNTLTASATSTLIIAETDALPGDAPGQKHILLGMDNTAASYASGGIDWTTLFPNTNEDDLINDLENYVNSDQTITDNALEGLVTFADGDAQTGITDNLGQSHSAWFTPSTDSSFTLMSWSNGNIVGSGTTTINVTPEPAPIVALGLGALGLLIRRRRKG